MYTIKCHISGFGSYTISDGIVYIRLRYAHSPVISKLLFLKGIEVEKGDIKEIDKDMYNMLLKYGYTIVCKEICTK